MQLRTTDLAAAVGGRMDGPDVTVDGATQDSRAVTPGQLFVPIVAERDGQEFIGAALANGAAAYLTTGRVEGAILRDCGHVPHLQQPESVRAALSAFIGRVTARDAGRMRA